MMKQNQGAEEAQGLKLAITGMDVRAPACDGLDAFERALQAGKDLLVPLPPNGYGHAGINTWLEQAVAGALKDARQPQALGVVVSASSADGSDLAGLIARRWKLDGPVLDLPVGDLAAGRGLQAAQEMLANSDVQAVLVVEDLPTSHAGAAIVLRRASDTWQSGDSVYAILAGGSSAGAGWTGPDLAEAARASLEQAGLATQVPSLLEVVGLPGGAAWTAGMAWLARGYPESAADPACAVGITAAGLLPGLVKAALCLHHRQTPPAPIDMGGPAFPLSPNSPFYRAEGSRPWFAPQDARRAAAVLSASAGGCAHFLLVEATGSKPRLAMASHDEAYLIPIAGDSLEQVLHGLQAFSSDLAETGLPAAAERAFDAYTRNASAAYALALTGRNADELQREISFARKGVPTSFEKQADWQTPGGSAFSPAPLGREGHIAFVYPGAFNSYIGMGRSLFRLFPRLHEQLSRVTSDPGLTFCEQQIYPRSRAPLTETELAAREAALVAELGQHVDFGHQPIRCVHSHPT